MPIRWKVIISCLSSCKYQILILIFGYLWHATVLKSFLEPCANYRSRASQIEKGGLSASLSVQEPIGELNAFDPPELLGLDELANLKTAKGPGQ